MNFNSILRALNSFKSLFVIVFLSYNSYFYLGTIWYQNK